jgi:hypothetical protein
MHAVFSHSVRQFPEVVAVERRHRRPVLLIAGAPLTVVSRSNALPLF